MKNVLTTTALILACGAAFASAPNNVETSPYFAKTAPSVSARADVKAQAAQAQRAGTIAHGESAMVSDAAKSTLSRSAIKADYLQAQKAGALPLMGERS